MYWHNQTEKKAEYAKLAEMVEAVENSLREAETYAIQHGLTFTFAPAYAMGGTFHGDAEQYAKVKDYNWNANGGDTGWAPSTGSC